MTEQQIGCAYCGKVRPLSEMAQRNLIGRGRKYDPRKGRTVACVTETLNWYCKDSPCAMHDQFAHEG
jgi:hypothetical protein